jgi:hypothetical protein
MVTHAHFFLNPEITPNLCSGAGGMCTRIALDGRAAASSIHDYDPLRDYRHHALRQSAQGYKKLHNFLA